MPKVGSQQIPSLSHISRYSKPIHLNSFFGIAQPKRLFQKSSLTLGKDAFIATTSHDPIHDEDTVQISELEINQKKLITPPLRGPKSQIISLKFNPDGTHVLAGTLSDNRLYLWQLPSEIPQTFPTIAGNGVVSIACNHDNTLLAVASRVWINNQWQSAIQLINVNDPQPIDLYDSFGNRYFKQQVLSLTLDSKNMRLASGHEGNTINIWNISQLERSKINKATPIPLEGIENVAQLTFDSSGSKLAGSNRTIFSQREEWPGNTGFILNLNTNQLIPLNVPEYWANNCIAFSPDDQYVITGGRYRRPGNHWFSVARLWDTNGQWLNQETLYTDSSFFGYLNKSTAFASFNNENNKILFISNDGFIRESDLSGKFGGELGSYGNNVIGFCCPDKNKLILQENAGINLRPY